MILEILCVGFSIMVLVHMFLSRKSQRQYFKKFEGNPELKPFEEMPGPLALPLIGTVYKLINLNLEDSFQLFRTECQSTYPEPLKTKLGIWYVVNLFRAEHVEAVVNNSVHIEKSKTYDFLKTWLGTGLLISTGEKWHTRRKMITPTFHFKILDIFTQVFHEKTSTLIKLLKQQADKNETFDIKPFISRCALDIICETAMGVSVNAQEDIDNEYLKAIQSISFCVIDRMLKPWLHPDLMWRLTENYRETTRSLKILHKFTDEVIAERKRIHETNKDLFKRQNEDDESLGKKHRLAFLDLLLHATVNGEHLNSADIREEVDTFMFEGHDTTTSGICFTLYLLGQHPDVQAKVQREIDEVLSTSESGSFTKHDLNNLKYLEMVIKESLRLYPSVPLIGRILSDDLIIGKYVCPKGTLVSINIFELHRDPQAFTDPEKFDPERFSPENCAKRHPYAFMPFSAGPRNCIGQKFALTEEKVIIANILKHFDIKTHVKQEDFRVMGVLVLRLSKDCMVSLSPRKSTE